MADEVLRLGVDPRPAEEGYRKFEQGADKAAAAAKRLTATVEQSARRETQIYRTAAAERAQLERELGLGSGRRVAEATQRAREAATAYVATQEQVFQSSVARIKEAQVRGLLSAKDAQQAARMAAAEYNAAIVRGLDAGPGFRRDDQSYTTLAGSLKDVDAAARSGSLGMHRLNNSLIVLARQATGTHPVVGQLADVVGTFAIGTARMVPILAGIAAIGFAWNRLTRDAREAREELRRNLDVLRDIARERSIEARGGERGIALAAAQDEARRIAEVLRGAAGDVLLGPGGAVSSAEPLRERLRELNALIREGLAEQADDERDARARARRERMRMHAEVEAATQAHLERLRRMAEEQRQIELTLIRQRWRAEDRIIAAAVEEQERKQREAHQAIMATVEHTLQNIENAADRELALIREREQANRALVRSIENVGRAYGGVVDQVLSLVAATISLEKLPMASGGDRARAYGMAGLAGIGYGQSTGSPALGAVGGAASGYAMAGPWGALVGGVTGIVSGLIEQGERAQRAAAQWKLALRDFEDMFTDFTPFEQAQRNIERQFVQLAQSWSGRGSGFTAGLTSVADARRLLEAIQGSEFLSKSYGDLARELDRLLKAYDRNVEAARDQTDATEDNAEALRQFTSALNSPSGFRLSYYQWLAAGSLPATSGPGTGGPPTTGGGQPLGPGNGGGGPNGERGDVYYVAITAGAGATFDGLVAEAQRRARRGGGDPLRVALR